MSKGPEKNFLFQCRNLRFQSCVISHSWNVLLKHLTSLEMSWNALEICCYLLKCFKLLNAWNAWDHFETARIVFVLCCHRVETCAQRVSRALEMCSWNTCNSLKPLEKLLKCIAISWNALNSWNSWKVWFKSNSNRRHSQNLADAFYQVRGLIGAAAMSEVHTVLPVL